MKLQPNWWVLIPWHALTLLALIRADGWTAFAVWGGIGLIVFVGYALVDFWHALWRNIFSHMPPSVEVNFTETIIEEHRPPRHPDPTRPRDDEWPVIENVRRGRRKHD
jgi:hypothetical protein